MRRVDEFLPYLNQLKPNLEVYLDATALEELSEEGIQNVLNKLEYTPSFTVHAPFMDLSPGAVDPAIREVTMKRFNQALSVAHEIGAIVVVFHSGYERWKYDHNLQIWLDASMKTWEPLVKKAVEYNLRIAIENIFETNPENLIALMENLKDDHFGLCFDTGHFNLFSEVSLSEWLTPIADRIMELHLHDNDGTRDHHWAPGKGAFDFTELFEILGRKTKGKIVPVVEAHSKEEAEDATRFFRERASSS